MEQLKKGKINIREISKNSPLGFRIWLTKDGEIKQAGAFKKTEEIQDYERRTNQIYNMWNNINTFIRRNSKWQQQ